VTRRVAVIGAGPSGFYASHQLLDAGCAVDLFDLLPTPYGLVRAGVAPDHPKIKSVTRVFDNTAAHDDFRFYGGVELGADVTRAELRQRYHALIYAMGTAVDRRLGIAGEDRPGSVAATDFVAWYNGHPGFADHDFPLHVQCAVVVGNGNVAIDVARMLALDPRELAPTDTADHAIERFRAASVEHVIVLGRRGPAHAAFTTHELRELGDLRRADVMVHPEDLEHELPGEMSSAAQRNLQLLREYADRPARGRSHRVELRFFRSPVELLGDDDAGHVQGLRVVKNEIVDGRALPTDQHEVIECGLVVRSIGYRGRPLPDVPFDHRSGLIPNAEGRVVDAAGTPLPGEYAVGWIKRGPSGVIGTNKKDALATVEKVREDAAAGKLDAVEIAGDPDSWVRDRVPGLVTWAGWQAIDDHETTRGQAQGRPRVKLVRVPEMVAIGRR
jgi:ferredoxin--NADP+ reductase